MFQVIIICLALSTSYFRFVNAQNSTCPEILIFKQNKNVSSEWEGSINLSPKHGVEGAVIKVKMNRKIDLFMNWFGETTTNDNKIYYIENLDIKINENDIYVLSFKTRINETVSKTTPRVEEIYFNGKLICPNKKKTPTKENRTLFFEDIDFDDY